jgi:benzylsuccinate CoA-transferase BbsF subunit
MSHQPLAGYRVLDFCWMIAGPLTTRLLADLGAEVIKVESLARLDAIREIGVQPPGVLTTDTNGVFNDCNTNKKSITLNLGTADGIRLAKELAAQSDVVTSNFTPARMDRWGLGYDDLRAVKEDIIVASLPVMGKDGPHTAWRSVGNGIIAMGGLNALTGFPNRAPVGLGTLHSDFTTPYFAALQIMAAVYDRERTGKGQFIELAQYESAVHLLDTEILDYLVNGVDTGRNGNRSPEFCPNGVFRCKGEDRWVAISVRDLREWRFLCEVIGLPDLGTREDLQELAGRRAIEPQLEALIEAWTGTRDRWEVAAALQARGVPAAAVEDVGDLVGDGPEPRDAFERVAHPAGIDILLQHQPITWDDERLPIARAPLFGEHNTEVFHDLLNIDEDALADLVAAGIVQ